MFWIIENENYTELAWSNVYGWCADTFDTFTDDEKESLSLPIGGHWVQVPWSVEQ